jgi:MoaA/NifB/PqqE/SkfB family radical SAM enzyme
MDQLEQQCHIYQKKFKLSITGGEPFVHPNFLEILKYVDNKINLTQLSVVSNGSLPYDLYEKASLYVTNLTISLHLEQDDKTRKQTIEKIIDLNKINGWFLNVNLMFLPGKLDLIKTIIDTFYKNNVQFVLRKIDPPYEDPNSIIKKKDINSLQQLEQIQKNFLKDKIFKKTYYNDTLDVRYLDYYSKEELDYLKSFDNKNQWNNIKLYLNNGNILETNTDVLKSNNQNSWKDWNCYIGVDSIYVQHDGTVYRGNCMQGESLGKLGDNLEWPKNTIICPIKWCSCNSDMIVRKFKKHDYKNLIDD